MSKKTKKKQKPAPKRPAPKKAPPAKKPAAKRKGRDTRKGWLNVRIPLDLTKELRTTAKAGGMTAQEYVLFIVGWHRAILHAAKTICGILDSTKPEKKK